MIISATFLPQVIYLGLLITKPFEDIFTMGHFFGNFVYAFELKQIEIVVETVVQGLLK